MGIKVMSIIAVMAMVAVPIVFVIVKKYRINQEIEEKKALELQEKMREKEENEDYEKYLISNGFIKCNTYGLFYIDNINKQWSIKLKKIIYKFDCISNAKIVKHRIGKNIYSNEVFIYTTDINDPIVKVNCGCSVTIAEQICSTIKIIRKQK